MKSYRLILLPIVVLAAALVGCTGGNHSADTEANVFLEVDTPAGVADININSEADVSVPNMIIKSVPKSSTTTLSSQDDVVLTEWVITSSRTDGGTKVSPEWRNYYQVTVPYGSSASLSNYRIFPATYFHEPPLNQLLSENGGFDKETGQPYIRQRLHIVIYGKTVSGKRITATTDYTIRFYYSSVVATP